MKLHNANLRECVEPNVVSTETARFLVVGHENAKLTPYFTLQIFHAYRWATAVDESISVLRVVDDGCCFEYPWLACRFRITYIYPYL